jgi:hypothetical protein
MKETDFKQKASILAAWDDKWEVPFVEAPEAEEIGNELIRRYHQDISKAKIFYYFKKKASKKKGKLELATITLTSPKIKFISEKQYDFYIEIGWTEWSELTLQQKIALIDHELCHAAFSLDKGKFIIVGHTVEEFREIIERYGFWTESVKAFGEACKRVKE